MELIDTTEMYLRTVYQLQEEGVVPLRARIAEALNHSGPTVSQTVGRMERDGLIQLTAERHLELTNAGATKAMRVMRKHRLAERLLVEVIGLPWAKVHHEACRWEHVMSDEVEQRLVQILAPPYLSPYGLTIPGLDEVGGGQLAGIKPSPAALSALALANKAARVVSARLVAVGESVQADANLLDQLQAAQLQPGCLITVEIAGRSRLLVTNQAPSGGLVELEAATAQHLLVAPEGFAS